MFHTVLKQKTLNAKSILRSPFSTFFADFLGITTTFNLETRYICRRFVKTSIDVVKIIKIKTVWNQRNLILPITHKKLVFVETDRFSIPSKLPKTAEGVNYCHFTNNILVL